MFDKKKIDFWRLTFIFGGITIITLFFLWSSPNKQSAKMMNASMGNMMKSMHLNNPSIYSILNMPRASRQMTEMASHHQNQDSIVYKLGIVTTSIIFLLIPFIVGGSIILTIVWIK